ARPTCSGRRCSASTLTRSWQNSASERATSPRFALNKQSDTTLDMTMITTPTEEVRRVLDTVKAEGRTALTAPEGKLLCEAYGIAVPQEGGGTSATEAASIATAAGFPVVL